MSRLGGLKKENKILGTGRCDNLKNLYIVLCFIDGVTIAAQCIATFLRSVVLPRIYVLLGRENADYILLRGLFFQAWGYLTSLKYQTRDPQLKFPPGGLELRIFTSWKNASQPDLNPQTLDLEASTLPQDHWGWVITSYFHVLNIPCVYLEPFTITSPFFKLLWYHRLLNLHYLHLMGVIHVQSQVSLLCLPNSIF